MLLWWAVLSKTLIHLSADGWGCVPSLLVVWPEATQYWRLQALWWGWWWTLGGLTPRRTSQNFRCQCPCPHGEPQPTSASTGDPLTTAGRSGPVSYGVTAPSPWVLLLTLPCVCPPRVRSLLPPVLLKPCSQIPLAFKVRFSGNSSSRCQTPQAWKPDVGLRTFTPVGGLMWYKCSPVCESPTQQLWDLILL